MGKRRLERHRPVPGRRRAARPRPRYVRLSTAGVALLATLVTVLGGLGVIPADAPAAADQQVSVRPLAQPAADPSAPPLPPATGSATASTAGSTAGSVTTPVVEATARTSRSQDRSTALPRGTGSGRRAVFDMSRQRVWLVAASGKVLRTYLVSGSLYDNLEPGRYSVYSRSRHAVGIDNSGTMEYFVRFTRGPNAAIGFHSIPVKDGRPVQTEAQLGTPLSHGCIRQAEPDARGMWDFAPLGTRVVVVA